MPHRNRLSEKSISRITQIKKKKKNIRRRKLYFWMGSTFFFLLVSILFLRIPFFYVKKVTVEGLYSLSSEQVSTEVKSRISGNMLFVIPKKNIFIISKKEIVSSLKKTFSSIESVSIKKKPFSEIFLTITEYTPSMLFCNGDTYNTDECFLLSNEGILFEKSPKFSSALYFTFYDVTSKNPPRIGFPVFDANTIEKVALLRKELDVLGMKASAFKRNENYDEIIISKKDNTASTFSILFKEDQTAETIISNLSSSLKSQTLKESREKRFSNLEYIDIRFNNKVFYKVK